MTESEIFLERHGISRFRHSERLLAGIRAGTCILSSGPAFTGPLLPCKHYFKIYRERAEHLSRFRTPNARSLRDDVLELCKELAKTPEELVLLWTFSEGPYYDFVVFEAENPQRILGCTFTVDQRLIEPTEWEKLWIKPGD